MGGDWTWLLRSAAPSCANHGARRGDRLRPVYEKAAEAASNNGRGIEELWLACSPGVKRLVYTRAFAPRPPGEPGGTAP